MSKLAYTSTVIFLLFLVMVVTRALPFVFSKILKNNEYIETIGKSLPAYIMLLLVIYEVHIETFTKAPYGIPAILALFSVVAVHVWKRSMLLSIAVGTVAFILLNLGFS